jgi:phage gp36-like protein
MPIIYATLADMQATFEERDLVQLSDWAGAGTIDQARIERALKKAGNKIDGYVAAKYGDRTALPVPPLLTELACDIAFYELHRSTPPDGVKDKHKAAIETLRDIAAGKVKIDEGVVDAQPARPGAIHFAGRKRFSRDELDRSL